MLNHIASRDNEQVKYARKIAGNSSFRMDEGLFFAEGKRLCFDLAATLKVRTVFFTRDFLKQNPQAQHLAPETYTIGEPVNDKLAETRAPQGIYCLFETPKDGLERFAAEKGIVVCENLQDPANVGAVLRSAAAFGVGGVVLLQGCADPFGSKALRAGMGAVGHVPLACGLTLPQGVQAVKAMGCTLYATALQGALPLAQTPVRKPFALLLGNEGAGLSEEAKSAASHRVYIPMHNGVESLNAAVAAGVFLYHFTLGQ